MTVVYLDSSALVKRAALEDGTEAVEQALAAADEAGAALVASALARVEVSRTLRTRLDAEDPRDIIAATTDALSGVAIAPVSSAILASARIIGPPVLRSLDAIHLATAIAVGADELWTYDRRMSDAAIALGLAVVAP